MEPLRPQRIEELYHAAVGLAPEARAALLGRADPDIRLEVESLLAYDAEEEPLARPVLEAAAKLLEQGAVAELQDRPDPIAIGQYRILSKLGEGGMGVVYRAEQEHPRRVVALKVIKPGWSKPELLRRFERESQALGRLQHPGIAQIYEAGTSNTGLEPHPYFAMEFIEGQSLGKYAVAYQLNTRARLDLLAKICDAVHHAHQRGIIHRDLKPGNILVDKTGQPKILDFGVARITDSDAQMTRQTDLGQLVGTLAYMSPEQVLADPLELDTRSDVYALGVILYELLAGRLPYLLSRKLHEAMQTIREADPEPLSSVSHTYRGDIETIVAKALEKDKARRYTSASDLAADIRHYLAHEPITARPPSTTYQLQKFAQRHRPLVAGVAAVFVVLVGGIVASTWEAVRADRAGQTAVAERDRALQAEEKAHAERDRAAAAEQATARERDRALSAEEVATKERNKAVTLRTQAIEERNRAVTEKRRADDEAATATAVSDFLQMDLLAQAAANAQAGPKTKPDPNLTVRTALDRAAARIPGKFEKQPLVEAAIRNTIGNSYLGLGLYAEAQSQIEQALELRRRLQGDEHRATLEVLDGLGSAYMFQGKRAAAETAFAKVVDVRLRVLGAEHPDTLSCMRRLGIVYAEQGKYAQAEPLYRKALEASRRVLGKEHPQTLETMGELADASHKLGNSAEAERLYAESLEASRRVRGEEHPATLGIQSNLSGLYSRQGRYAQAEELVARSVEINRRIHGEEHPYTLLVMSNLAVVSEQQGKYAQAETLDAKVVEIFGRVLGPEHPNTLMATNNLARVYSRQGKYALAEPLHNKTLETMRRALGGEHPMTLTAMVNSAEMYRRQAKFSQAGPLYAKVLEIRRRLLGSQNPSTTDVMASLGELQLLDGKYGDAEPLLREALNAIAKMSPESWTHYYCQSLLGAVLTGQKRYLDAEPLLLSGYEGVIQRAGKIPASNKSNLTSVGEWIVQLYRDWGKPDKAATWRSRLNGDKSVATTAPGK